MSSGETIRETALKMKVNMLEKQIKKLNKLLNSIVIYDSTVQEFHNINGESCKEIADYLRKLNKN